MRVSRNFLSVIPAVLRLFGGSNGFEQATERRRDQMDDGREGGDVAVTTGVCPGSLEQAIEALQASIAVQRGPALQDSFAVHLDGVERLAHRIEDRVWIEKLGGRTEEVGGLPPCGLNGLRLADPA